MRATFLAIVLALCACQFPPPSPPNTEADGGKPKPPVVDPPEPDDAGPDVDLGAPPCEQACAVLKWLGCPEGDPTPRERSCTDVCQEVEDFPNLTLKPHVVARCRDIACARRGGVRCRP